MLPYGKCQVWQGCPDRPGMWLPPVVQQGQASPGPGVTHLHH